MLKPPEDLTADFEMLLALSPDWDEPMVLAFEAGMVWELIAGWEAEPDDDQVLIRTIHFDNIELVLRMAESRKLHLEVTEVIEELSEAGPGWTPTWAEIRVSSTPKLHSVPDA